MKEIFIITFLYGIILKIYDDMIDNKLQINKYITDFFCYATISLVTLSCYLSGSFSLIYLEMTLLTFAMDYLYTYQFKQDTEESKDFQGMNDSIWIYTCIVSAIFTIYYFTNNKVTLKIDSFKKYTLLIFAVINFFIITLDIYLTPEHSSNNKYNARVIMFILILFTVLGMIVNNNYFYNGTIGVMLMHLGFLVSSLVYLSIENTSYVQNLKPKQKKEKPILKKKNPKLKKKKKENKKPDKIY